MYVSSIFRLQPYIQMYDDTFAHCVYLVHRYRSFAISHKLKPMGALSPARNVEGLFQSGSRGGALTAESSVLHDPNAPSLPYLDSWKGGILHVIPSWNQGSIISELSGSFTALYYMRVRVPFLQNVTYHVRKYVCNGASVCPKTTDAFRSKLWYCVNLLEPDVLGNF